MVKLSYLIPRSELTHEEVEDIKRQAMNELVQTIQSKGNDPKDYIVRDVLPAKDLGLSTNNEWKFSISGAGEATLINIKVPDDTYIAFYGVAYPDPTKVLTTLKFKKGEATTLAVFQLEKLFAELEPVGYFRQPVVYGPTDSLLVLADATGADDSEKIVLRAFLAEPANRTISA